MKVFNTTGACVPQKHYMVDLTGRLKQIKEMIDSGCYFAMNRARQYGKTTTLAALCHFVAPEYDVISLDFQGIGNAGFDSEENFVQSLCRLILRETRSGLNMPENIYKSMYEFLNRKENRARLDELFDAFAEWCLASDRRIVLLVDEVDSATNNQVFLDFLAQLRDGYISRDTKGAMVFQSAILAGVTDIKNLRRKIRPDEAHKMNSPWNIAADFKVDMSFSPHDIEGMLFQYEEEHHSGMDVHNIANCIYEYTAGYPFLVSRICKIVDEDLAVNIRFETLGAAWTEQGISEAVRWLLMEKNTLFESLMGKVQSFTSLSDILKKILFDGEKIPYNPDNQQINDAEMYGFIKNDGGEVRIANRIFETRLYNYYLSSEEIMGSDIYTVGNREKEQFVRNGYLDMEHLLERFVVVFDDLYGDQKIKFDEEEGRRRFLLFIRPIINGTGNYYIEAQTRNNERMDLVIDYLGQRYVVELKVWRGNAYNERGEQQLSDYLSYYHLNKGYMLSFCFNQKKKTGVHRIQIDGKEIVEAVV